ncbi:unnamed protein product [Pneumocystis jirovecii]|uniref:Major facilitator superfamily (MFS) profile domain-containing protein n=2 Tax=Pneumocystis jirovecii TaxID=42068 RepID=L0PEN4_PNEJI|nr:uncharacterized protein T551_02057 [Pneumocystis jirovecii RU7]KTW29441.1 hypothetical protein T551_02057 [Pneumocystis jirovecii RU7]CCJ30095.1 unnamed protein product [Pneumocystis jirovecii]
MYTIYHPVAVAAAATIGAMLFGFDISSVSAFVTAPQYLEYFNRPSPFLQGVITSSMPAGSAISSLFSGFITNRIGHKAICQLSAWIWIVGAIIQSASGNAIHLILGRFISSIAIGLSSSQIPVWISELSPKNKRGCLISIFQWSITWGICIMFYISYGCTWIKGPTSFRVAWGIQVVPGLIFSIFVFFLPQSPRWLASHDRWEEAQYIISKVNNKSDYNNPDVVAEIEEIRQAVKIDKDNVGYSALFAKGSRKRTSIGFFTHVWQQFTGMNVIMYYVAYVFRMAGYKGTSNLLVSSIQYVLNVIMTIPALLFIDKWGRRPTFIYGAILMAILLYAESTFMSIGGRYISNYDGSENIRWTMEDHPNLAKAAIACSYLFVCVFASTWGPCAWIYVSEIFPHNQRTKANGLCTFANWTFNFVLAIFVPTAFKNIQWKTFIIFAVFSTIMAVHVYLMFPETCGRSLEEIEQIWKEKIPAWKTKPIKMSKYNDEDTKKSYSDEIKVELNEKKDNEFEV